jgi:NADH-quinone oxidoreductase subunit A
MATMSSILATILQPQSAWAPVVLLVVIALMFGAMTLIMSRLVGPSRTGAAKETTYESGMMPSSDARRRFNARFYIVAMIFVVFDVEIVFFYPWATIFPRAEHPIMGVLLAEMAVFIVILLVAYLYAWGKGVFDWD